MAIRLLPFRQYNEHDVINLFTLEKLTGNNAIASEASGGTPAPEINGSWDNGVIVTISACDLTKEPIEYGNNDYLGKTDYPHIGRNQYPSVPHTVKQAIETFPLGVTLRQTLTHDENGEKLLYYPQKALELNAVFPGQAVPILTRGLITVSEAGLAPAVLTGGIAGQAVLLGKGTNGAGKFAVAADAGGDKTAIKVGTLIGLGDREGVGTNPDYFAGTAGSTTGGYALIKLEL